MEKPRLPRALRIVTGDRPTRPAVRVVVDRCHRIACAYLRQQRQVGALREDVLGRDVEDLAMDTIAGLFERDEKGRFPELQRYFADRDLERKSPGEIEEDLRRLVLGTVTDGLFEAYRTADRILSNLIRALKRVLKQREDAHLRRRGKSLWLEIDPDSSVPKAEAPGPPHLVDMLRIGTLPQISHLGDRPLLVGDDLWGRACARPVGRRAIIRRAKYGRA